MVAAAAAGLLVSVAAAAASIGGACGVDLLGENKISKEEVMLELTFLVNLISYFMSVAIILPRGEAREERGNVDRYW